jgi:uncharacterized surface protein with fasciclin (FAS1) repeats
VKTRTRKLGIAAAIAAIAVSLPLSITAYADPDPTAEFPDPQGPGCDAFKAAVPTYKSLHLADTGTALASIPDISTFNSAVSGKLNPAVNLVPSLNPAPFVIFAPTNDAFAKEPERLEALKADPAALSKFLYYHMFMGLLGPDDVKGQRPSQAGPELKVTGKGGDVKVNDTAKVVCGGIVAGNARIYTIDTVLDPASGPEPITPSGTSSTSATAASATTTTTPTSPAPPPPPAQ